MIVKTKIANMVDRLPEKEQYFVYDLVRRLVLVCDEDIASMDDIQAIKEADAEYQRGETLRYEDIVW